MPNLNKPVSNQQRAANRANSQKSTGPKTPAGKQSSSKNATTHGLHSRSFIVEPHQQSAFDDLKQTLHAEILPLGALEIDAFRQLLHAAWQLRRADALEAGLHSPDDDLETQLQRLERLSRLRASLERSYQRAYRRLRDLQSIRAAELKLTNAGALVHSALTPLAPAPKPDPPPEIAGAKRSHFEPSLHLYQWLETHLKAHALPQLPIRSLVRLSHQVAPADKADKMDPNGQPLPDGDARS